MELVSNLSRRQFIDGEWVESSNKETREIINPYNQEVIFEVAEGTAEDSERAILAARRSFEKGEWANETSENRGKKSKSDC
ncbi:glycine betaine aldehyde dehydrogenase [Staphylococcus gallinarum]|uniref:Glycine betaine aldehyde dehydrogenase n=1 Tax=Staphylococcus gallinarum TaxID=1293 RepID=A0A380FP25_STAGA|nr:glycine betaine aldehyde dehydrogenase [Staphylococcus gallinarum]